MAAVSPETIFATLTATLDADTQKRQAAEAQLTQVSPASCCTLATSDLTCILRSGSPRRVILQASFKSSMPRKLTKKSDSRAPSYSRTLLHGSGRYTRFV